MLAAPVQNFKETLNIDWVLVQKALSDRSRSGLGKSLSLTHGPLSNVTEAGALLSRVREAVAQIAVAAKTRAPSLQSYFANIEDPTELFERASRDAVLDPRELWLSAQFVEGVSFFADQIRKFAQHCPILAGDFASMPPLPAFCERVKRSVSSDGAILDTASPDLARLRADRASRRTALEARLESKLKEWHAGGVLQDKFYDYVDGRLVVPVKADQQSKLDGILVSKSNTGQSVFIEPLELTSANNGLKETDLKIRAEEYRILRMLSGELMGLVDTYAPWIPVVAETDLAFAAAELAKDWEMTPPVLKAAGATSPALRLKEFFHPQLAGRAVKNSMEMAGGGHVLLISGPNTGGKTVLIKAVAVACEMARAGLYVPAGAGAEIPFYAGIHSLIGDEQDLSKGLSSFSGQVSELQSVLADKATPQLIVIDEILSSTDPEEASVLAQAMLEELRLRGHHVLVTSHFSDLSVRSKQLPGFHVAAMEFDTASRDPKPTFRMRPDELGSSHALDVAKRLGVAEKVLLRARSLLSTEKLEYQRAKEELQTKEKRIEAEHQAALSTLQLKHDREVSKLRGELEKFIAESGAKVEKQIEEIKREYARARMDSRARVETHKTRQVVAEESARQLVGRVKDLAEGEFGKPLDLGNNEEAAEDTTDTAIRVGTTVRVRSLARTLGTVADFKQNGAIAVVQVGNFRVERPMSDLVFHAQAPAKPRGATKIETPELPHGQQLPLKLDLRGQRVEEALANAERFLDQSVRVGRVMVTIITGHGTGKVKAGLKELLATLPYVKEFKPERGSDDGALTIEFER